jgi:hypothetical protein
MTQPEAAAVVRACYDAWTSRDFTGAAALLSFSSLSVAATAGVPVSEPVLEGEPAASGAVPGQAGSSS